MVMLVASNNAPRIQSLLIRRHATNTTEADEIFAQRPEGKIVKVDVDSMPFTEQLSTLNEEEQPKLKKFRAGEAFRLVVYNFDGKSETPLIGFTIEPESDPCDIYIKGSDKIVDPLKAGLIDQATAIIPLQHIFSDQIRLEAKRASDLIKRASGNKGITSLNDEIDKRTMSHALNAVHNVMQSLRRGEQKTAVEPHKTGKDGIVEKLGQALDAEGGFYDVLMAKTREAFEPSIRTLAEKLALNGMRIH